MKALENKKLVLADRLCADAVLANPNAVAIDPATITSAFGKIFEVLNSMILDVNNYRERPVIYCNSNGFQKMINERNSQGNPINQSNAGFNFDADWHKAIRENRPVGYFNGIEIWVVSNKAIGNNYSTNASGVIQVSPNGTIGNNIVNAQTTSYVAGNKTAFIVANPADIGLIAGSNDQDTVYNSNDARDWTSFSTDDFKIGMLTSIGAGAIAPQTMRYFAV